VADALHLDKVLWIPAGDPPHKRDSPVSRPEMRLAMVRAAAAADPRFEVSTVEMDRPGASYMVDTVKSLRATYPTADLYLIIGADEFRAFASWRRPEEIVGLVRLAVMDRAGESAATFRDGVPGGDEAVFVPVRRVDCSSSDIRARRRRGEDVGAWLQEGVRAIIERERLYSAS